MLRHLAPETTFRAAIVVRGIQGDSEIVAKSSHTDPEEVRGIALPPPPPPGRPFSPDGQSGLAMAWLVICWVATLYTVCPVRPWLDVRVASMGIELVEMVQGNA